MVGLLEEHSVFVGGREAAAPNLLAAVALEGVRVLDDVNYHLLARLTTGAAHTV